MSELQAELHRAVERGDAIAIHVLKRTIVMRQNREGQAQ